MNDETEIYEGNAWKRERAPEPKPAARTRAQEQEYLNTEYANGRLTLNQWRLRTNELSEVTKWSAAGAIK